MEKQDFILLEAMEQGYVYYPIDVPDDCYKYMIDCLYYNTKMQKYYLYVSDGVGELFSDEYNVTWSLTNTKK